MFLKISVLFYPVCLGLRKNKTPLFSLISFVIDLSTYTLKLAPDSTHYPAKLFDYHAILAPLNRSLYFLIRLIPVPLCRQSSLKYMEKSNSYSWKNGERWKAERKATRGWKMGRRAMVGGKRWSENRGIVEKRERFDLKYPRGIDTQRV